MDIKSKVLTIDRGKWRRGGEAHNRMATQGSTFLCNAKGLMCCLGFDALACGVDKTLLTQAGEPGELLAWDLPPAYIHSPRFFAHTREPEDQDEWEQSTLVLRAIKDNDNEELTDEQREVQIREDLIALGWEDVEFTGTYPEDDDSGIGA